MIDREGNLGNEEMAQKFDVNVQNIKMSNGNSYDFAEWTDMFMP